MRKFHFSSICNVLPCKLRLFWYSTRVLNRHLANKLPTCGQQSADKRPTVGRLLAEKAVNDSRPTVGQQLADCRPTVGRLSVDCRPTVVQLSANCWPTVGRLLANSRPTVFWGSCSSLFPVIAVLRRTLDSENGYHTGCRNISC